MLNLARYDGIADFGDLYISGYCQVLHTLDLSCCEGIIVDVSAVENCRALYTLLYTPFWSTGEVELLWRYC